MQSFYEKSEACVRVCREVGEWSEVGVGLREVCVMSPWLFNLFMDAVMKEFREKADDVGAILLDEKKKKMNGRLISQCLQTIMFLGVSEALFPLCRGTYISTLFGVCPTFRSRTTAIILFFLF